MKDKGLKIIIGAVILFIVLIAVYFLFIGGSDAKKFDREYSIGEDNVFVYKNAKEVVDILKNGTGIVYMGFPECPWCQAYVKILNDSAKENGVDKIYYLNIKNDRENNSKEYQEIVNLLRGKLVFYNEGKEKVTVPYVAFIANGKIIDYDNETSTMKDDITPAQFWTKEEKEKIKTKFKVVFEQVSKQGMCTDCNK